MRERYVHAKVGELARMLNDGGWTLSIQYARRARTTYDVGIDQARHDEFAGLRAEIDEVVLARLQSTRGNGVVDGRWLNVVLDPDDIAIQPGGDQAPRKCVIVRQCLWIDDWAIVDVDHDVETKVRELGRVWGKLANPGVFVIRGLQGLVRFSRASCREYPCIP